MFNTRHYSYITTAIIITLVFVFSATAFSQIPYYAGTVGNNRVEAYTSLKIRPGVEKIGSYNSFQYGIGNNFAAGTDLTVANGNTYWGFIGRMGFKFNKRINLGVQLTPTFNLNNSFHFHNLCSALYLNGAITQDEKLFWVSNTMYTYNDGCSDDIDQWIYLGYRVNTGKSQSITPMVGTLYSWKLDSNADIGVGAYYNLSKFNFYLWGDDLLKSHPRMVIGLEVCL